MVYRIVPHTSKQIIVLSNFVKRDVAAYAHVRPSKITVTYAAADFIPDPPEALPSLAEKGFLLYVGRPLPHKNLPRLIEAFKTLKLQHPELKLVLAGKKDALYESIENEVSRQGIKDVVFTGFVTEGNLRWLYEHCAAYIFPSLSEGFGLPGLEAMEHGAPVVSSNATCLPEIYGDAAFYFNPTDIGSIVSAINNVLVDPILREQLIERGRTQVKKFSWPRMASETLSVYRKVLNS